jgi:hypothetical protein
MDYQQELQEDRLRHLEREGRGLDLICEVSPDVRGYKWLHNMRLTSQFTDKRIQVVSRERSDDGLRIGVYAPSKGEHLVYAFCKSNLGKGNLSRSEVSGLWKYVFTTPVREF